MHRRQTIAIASTLWWSRRLLNWILDCAECPGNDILKRLVEAYAFDATRRLASRCSFREKRAIIVLSTARGRDGKPLDLRQLANGRKGIKELLEEVRDREVRLIKDRRTRRAVRTAISIKILVDADGYRLLETKRRYRSGEVVEKDEEWSFSETRILGESIEQTVARAWQQEAIRWWERMLDGGITLRPEYFNPLWPDEMIIQERESRVYHGIQSRTLIRIIGVNLPYRPWKRGHWTPRDHGVRVYSEWFPKEPMSE